MAQYKVLTRPFFPAAKSLVTTKPLSTKDNNTKLTDVSLVFNSSDKSFSVNGFSAFNMSTKT